MNERSRRRRYPATGPIRWRYWSGLGRRRGAVVSSGLILGLVAVLVTVAPGRAAEAPVELGTAEPFGVLAGAGVTNTGPSVIDGDLGTCPTPAVTGFGPAPLGTVNGVIHANDEVACGAQADLTIAYNDAAGREPTVTFAGAQDLVGLTLAPGVYQSPSELSNAGLLQLDALGDPTAVFIFQAGSTLITAVDSSIELINGAQACNVFWQVGSSATLGVDSTFVGTILASAAITANTNARVEGRLLTSVESVTLDTNAVTPPECAAETTTTEAPTSTSTTTGPGTSTTEAPTSTTTGPGTSTTAVVTSTTPGATLTPALVATTVRVTGATPTTSPRGSTPTTVSIPALSRTGAAYSAETVALALVLMVLGGQMAMMAARRRQGVRHD